MQFEWDAGSQRGSLLGVGSGKGVGTMIVTYEIKISSKPRKPLSPEEIAAIEARAPRDEDVV